MQTRFPYSYDVFLVDLPKMVMWSNEDLMTFYSICMAKKGKSLALLHSIKYTCSSYLYVYQFESAFVSRYACLHRLHLTILHITKKIWLYVVFATCWLWQRLDDDVLGMPGWTIGSFAGKKLDPHDKFHMEKSQNSLRNRSWGAHTLSVILIDEV